jgi:hypothetical protein
MNADKSEGPRKSVGAVGLFNRISKPVLKLKRAQTIGSKQFPLSLPQTAKFAREAFPSGPMSKPATDRRGKPLAQSSRGRSAGSDASDAPRMKTQARAAAADHSATNQ